MQSATGAGRRGRPPAGRAAVRARRPPFGAAADLGQHLVEVAARHRQVAAHLGDQQPVVGGIAPDQQRGHQQRQHHQQGQPAPWPAACCAPSAGEPARRGQLRQRPQALRGSCRGPTRRSGAPACGARCPATAAARVLSPCTESSTERMCCFSSACRSVAEPCDTAAVAPISGTCGHGVQRGDVERAQNQRALDQVAQFAHVARPVVLHQAVHLGVADVQRRHAQQGRELAMKWRARPGMSSLCSRSGGRVISTTCSR